MSAGQINCLVPYGVSGSSVAVAVNNKGTFSNTVSIPLAAMAPGIFTLDSSGTNSAAVLHLDGSLVNAASPAKKGEIVAMCLTGLGALSTAVPDGQGATAANAVKAPLQLLVNGTLGVCRNEKGDMRFGNRVIRIGEAVAGHFSTTERGERRDRG